MFFDRDDPNSLNLIEPDIGGGRISKDTIDRISACSQSKLQVSGLTQETFDYLIENYGGRFTDIEFWKCPLVSDLSKLSSLKTIESISFYWNQRAECLWDMSSNHRLASLSLDDFTRIHSLEDLKSSKSLEFLSFGNKIWPKMVLESLDPISSVRSLRRLHFDAKKLADGRVTPISRIELLEELEFPPRMFSTEKVAWLRARLHSGVKSKVLSAVHKLKRPLVDKEKRLDTLVIGKRKPLLDSRMSADRIARYVKKFDELVAKYRNDPDACEPD